MSTRSRASHQGVGLAGCREGWTGCGLLQCSIQEGVTKLEGEIEWVCFVAAYVPTDSHQSVRDKDLLRATLGITATEAPKEEYLIVMMDANARTGARGEGFVDVKVMGAYGRDTLSDNGRRLLAFSAENQLALVKTFFSTPKRI